MMTSCFLLMELCLVHNIGLWWWFYYLTGHEACLHDAFPMPYLMCFWDIPGLVSCAFSAIPNISLFWSVFRTYHSCHSYLSVTDGTYKLHTCGCHVPWTLVCAIRSMYIGLHRHWHVRMCLQEWVQLCQCDMCQCLPRSWSWALVYWATSSPPLSLSAKQHSLDTAACAQWLAVLYVSVEIISRVHIYKPT